MSPFFIPHALHFWPIILLILPAPSGSILYLQVHQLNPLWSEDHKQRYIKNVTREYKIHREMRHPRVVDFYDVFEIDVNSFATVLEYCRGIDLDEKYVLY